MVSEHWTGSGSACGAAVAVSAHIVPAAVSVGDGSRTAALANGLYGFDAPKGRLGKDVGFLTRSFGDVLLLDSLLADGVPGAGVAGAGDEK